MANVTISEIYNNHQVDKMQDDDLLLVSKKSSGSNEYTSAAVKFNKLVSSVIDSSFTDSNFYIKYSNGIVIQGGKTTIDFPSSPDKFDNDLAKDVTLSVTLSTITTAKVQVTGNYTNANLLTSPYPCDYNAKLKNISTLNIILDHSGCNYTAMMNILSHITYHGGYKYAANPGNIPADYDLSNDYYLDGDPNNKTPANVYRSGKAWIYQARENALAKIQSEQPNPITADWLVIGQWK